VVFKKKWRLSSQLGYRLGQPFMPSWYEAAIPEALKLAHCQNEVCAARQKKAANFAATTIE
jgi:hypothetical protein